MNVLSLFDGMSGARLALEKADIKVDKYFASEVDKYAMKVSSSNYPDIVQIGSVVELSREELLALGDIDLLIGGSPCQGFSTAGKQKGSSTSEGVDVTSLSQYLELKELGFEFDGQSYLFWEYVRVWKIVKPKYFFLENVRVNKKWLPMFNEAMGVEPVEINSALLSAQNRVRYYWTNIPNVTQPDDNGIILKDILEEVVLDKFALSDSAINYMDRERNGKPRWEYHRNDINNKSSTIVAVSYKGVPYGVIGIPNDSLTKDGKAYALTASYGGAVAWNSIKRRQRSMVSDKETNEVAPNNVDGVRYRKLTPVECERLQTVPDNYTSCVSNSQRYKMIGNGFTIDVVAHILKRMK